MTDALRFPTQIVGSWCKPTWLADHDAVYGPEGSWWRVPADRLADAQDDAVRLAIYDQQRAGLSRITDGEQRRQSFSGFFYSLGGIDAEHPGEVTDFSSDVNAYLTMKQRAVTSDAEGKPAPPPKFTQPRAIGPISWEQPLLGNATRFLLAHTDRPTKVTIVGPVTLSLRLVDEHYGSPADLAFGVADAINAELKLLASLGVSVAQLDEPEVHFRHSQVKEFAAEAIDRALAGVDCGTAVHMCYGYSKNIAEKRSTPVYADALALLASTTTDEISLEYAQPGHGAELLTHAGDKRVALGVLNLDTEAPVETADQILGIAEPALEVVGPDRLGLAPDCGMWFLPRDTALAKISAMETAAQQLRARY
jgi:5-methyltetrahydropteroyltriglutamate--homocysteine methyltransferase